MIVYYSIKLMNLAIDLFGYCFGLLTLLMNCYYAFNLIMNAILMIWLVDDES